MLFVALLGLTVTIASALHQTPTAPLTVTPASTPRALPRATMVPPLEGVQVVPLPPRGFEWGLDTRELTGVVVPVMAFEPAVEPPAPAGFEWSDVESEPAPANPVAPSKLLPGGALAVALGLGLASRSLTVPHALDLFGAALKLTWRAAAVMASGLAYVRAVPPTIVSFLRSMQQVATHLPEAVGVFADLGAGLVDVVTTALAGILIAFLNVFAVPEDVDPADLDCPSAEQTARTAATGIVGRARALMKLRSSL